MVLRLIIKDLMAYRTTITLNFILLMIMGNIFTFQYYPWHVYMMYGYLGLAFISTFFSFTEKNRNTEVLTCSLPVARSTIVHARYLVSAILTIGGLMLWIGNAYVASLIYPEARSIFDHVMHFKVLFMALFFISVYSSIFLPSVFSFRLLGTVLTFIVALVTAVASIPLIFHPYRGSYNPYFEYGALMSFTVLFMIMVVAPVISFALSLKLYNSKDI